MVIIMGCLESVGMTMIIMKRVSNLFAMVQKRNIEALNKILLDNPNQAIVIGTHGTALSTILNFYDDSFGCDDFLRIIDWMPYIIELDFEGNHLVG